MVDRDFIFEDADGCFKVVRFLGWTEDGRCWCNCKTPVEEWPESGWQIFAAIYRKDGKHRATYYRGIAEDPSIYRLVGREFVGTMMKDEEYDTLCAEAILYATALRQKLDAST